MFPEWHHAVPESAYFKVPETLKTFRMYSTSRYAPCATRLVQCVTTGYRVCTLDAGKVFFSGFFREKGRASFHHVDDDDGMAQS